ncbi:hypothetical protein [Bacillus bombysepticus]|uniref:hypothetical protein n=1 Tax=Bacillus bombysepticus TaxID=658666 RepID=UPI0030158D0B
MYQLIRVKGQEAEAYVELYNWNNMFSKVELLDMNVIQYFGLIKYVQNWYWEHTGYDHDAIMDFGLLPVSSYLHTDFTTKLEETNVNLIAYLNEKFDEDVNGIIIKEIALDEQHLLILTDEQGNKLTSKEELSNIEQLGLSEYIFRWKRFGHLTNWKEDSFVNQKMIKNISFKGHMVEEFDNEALEWTIIGFSIVNDGNNSPAIVLQDKNGNVNYFDFN